MSAEQFGANDHGGLGDEGSTHSEASENPPACHQHNWTERLGGRALSSVLIICFNPCVRAAWVKCGWPSKSSQFAAAWRYS